MVASGLGAPRGGDEEVTEAGDRADPVDVMKVLVEHGADINAINDVGNTALHYAAQRGPTGSSSIWPSRARSSTSRTSRAARPADFARGRTAALVAQLSGAPAPAAPGQRPATPAAPSQR